MGKCLKGFSFVVLLISAVTLFSSYPVLASGEDKLLTFTSNFVNVKIGNRFSTPYDSAKEIPFSPESLLLYPLTAEKSSPIVTNREVLVTEISLLNDDPERKTMTLKYDEQLYVKIYYSFQPEYQVGEIIPAGKTIAQYSSENEDLLVLEVLKDGQRQFVQDYIEIEKK